MDNSETPGPILDLLKDDLNERHFLLRLEIYLHGQALEKSIEKLEDALIIPFYEDDFVSLKNFIKEKSDKRDFNFDDSAIHAIISMSGFERSQVSDAVERIMLYYEFSENKNINDEKIKEILFDTNQNQISELCKHICLGETRLSQQSL
jgi:DNA polymerase III delta subunit